MRGAEREEVGIQNSIEKRTDRGWGNGEKNGLQRGETGRGRGDKEMEEGGYTLAARENNRGS